MPPRTFGPAAPDADARKHQVTVEGNILDVIIHREPGAPDEEGLSRFYESGALIDTGASHVCIDYRMARALKLRQIDQQTVATPGGSILAAIYLGVLEVPALDYKRVTRLYALKVGQTSYNVILGRSFLAEYIVTFDGPKGLFHFAHPTDHLPGEPFDE